MEAAGAQPLFGVSLRFKEAGRGAVVAAVAMLVLVAALLAALQLPVSAVPLS